MNITRTDCKAGSLLDSGAVAWYNYLGESDHGSVMNLKFLLVLCVLCGLSIFSVSPSRGATVVTFDDISGPRLDFIIPQGYQGLSWSNFYCVNAVLESNLYGADGAVYGMVSPSNVADNADGFPAEIDSQGTNFDFFSAYLTGGWNSNLEIQVEGFRGGSLVYNMTVTAAATNATLFTFDYTNIDRLYFNSFGGQDAGFGEGAGEEFAMDNFTFEFIPEPSSLLLTVFGSVSLVAFLRRRRA